MFTNCDGDDATTGDLYAELDLSFLVDPEPMTPGYLVFKELDGETFRQGLCRRGADRRARTARWPRTPWPHGRRHHPSTRARSSVNVDTTAGERELPADLIRLAQTQERFHLDIPYIGFDDGRDTSLRMRFYVPTGGLPGNPRWRMRMQLLGRADGTLPVLTLTYRILPRPATPKQPPRSRPAIADALPELAAEAVPDHQHHAGDRGRPVHRGPERPRSSTSAAGDTILVTLTGTQPSDGYTGEVGLMRPVGILTVA